MFEKNLQIFYSKFKKYKYYFPKNKRENFFVIITV